METTMASPAIVAPPTPVQMVKGLAGAIPSDLSKSPLLGILGVIMGAGIVTLTGRMIGLGLADLKGHVGISFDDGTWLGSAFNIALMFIGPFTVYLGALMGPRRVLFFAATSFTFICLFIPFIHNYSLLLVALTLAGLTSGTFYPLTLTFALRNIPSNFFPSPSPSMQPLSMERSTSLPRSTAGIATTFPGSGRIGTPP